MSPAAASGYLSCCAGKWLRRGNCRYSAQDDLIAPAPARIAAAVVGALDDAIGFHAVDKTHSLRIIEPEMPPQEINRGHAQAAHLVHGFAVAGKVKMGDLMMNPGGVAEILTQVEMPRVGGGSRYFDGGKDVQGGHKITGIVRCSSLPL